MKILANLFSLFLEIVLFLSEFDSFYTLPCLKGISVGLVIKLLLESRVL